MVYYNKIKVDVVTIVEIVDVYFYYSVLQCLTNCLYNQVSFSRTIVTLT